MGRKDICSGKTFDTACAADEKKSYCRYFKVCRPENRRFFVSIKKVIGLYTKLEVLFQRIYAVELI